MQFIAALKDRYFKSCEDIICYKFTFECMIFYTLHY